MDINKDWKNHCSQENLMEKDFTSQFYPSKLKAIGPGITI